MRALVLALCLTLLTAAPAQAAKAGDLVEFDMGDVHDGWVNLCSYVDLHDEAPCAFETCTLPNEKFPDVPEHVMPVTINVSQCLEDVIETIQDLISLPVGVTLNFQTAG